jgi:ABC-2 type transport system ATP-binding protein
MNANEELVIDVRNLTKRFYGKAVVNGVSLQVKKGEIYGFLGPNGSGKTTTIRMICGLLSADGGEGTCLGYQVLTESELIKQNVGYMTQKFSLYDDLTIKENLDFVARMYALPNRKALVQESIDRLGIGRERQKQFAGTLSGGWKQRLALAAVTIHQPKLLLLDEPTAGVDPKARRDFWDEIHKLSTEGVTTLVSTHYMDEAERCDRLAYIAYGNMLTSGTLEQVIADAKLFTWEVQSDNTNILAAQLKQDPVFTQVTAFGRVLHVSGVNEQAMLASIKKFEGQGSHWQPIKSNLEDVFIHFMETREDNFA